MWSRYLTDADPLSQYECAAQGVVYNSLECDDDACSVGCRPREPGAGFPPECTYYNSHQVRVCTSMASALVGPLSSAVTATLAVRVMTGVLPNAWL